MKEKRLRKFKSSCCSGKLTESHGSVYCKRCGNKVDESVIESHDKN